MNKPHIILWGGSWTVQNAPLTLLDLDSHAKVAYFFLKQALEEFFDVTGIEEFDTITTLPALLKPETCGVISTFQGGFTQLATRKPDVYTAIASSLEGKKFSIIDEIPFARGKEDALFTVIPPRASLKGFIKTLFSPADIHHMGWCAAPAQCYPEDNDIFTIFVDHGHYAGTDYTEIILKACQGVKAPMQILIQTNDGIEQWNKDAPWHNDQYIRANKIPWPTMMETYRRCDMFCLTHFESAGLSTIEAAMSGARIIIPEIDGVPFINKALITADLDTKRVPCSVAAVQAVIEEAISTGVDRHENHKRIIRSHSWAIAARNIAAALRVL